MNGKEQSETWVQLLTLLLINPGIWENHLHSLRLSFSHFYNEGKKRSYLVCSMRIELFDPCKVLRTEPGIKQILKEY